MNGGREGGRRDGWMDMGVVSYSRELLVSFVVWCRGTVFSLSVKQEPNVSFQESADQVVSDELLQLAMQVSWLLYHFFSNCSEFDQK